MSLGKGAAPAAPFSLRSGGNEGGGIETEGLRRAREQRRLMRKERAVKARGGQIDGADDLLNKLPGGLGGLGDMIGGFLKK